MKTVKTTLMTLTAVAVVGWIGYRFYQAYQPEPVTLQGQIESQQYSISSKVPGRIDQVLVRKGDQVEKGQLIFTLLSPEIDAKLEQAIAGQKAAGALAQEAENGAREQQIQAAKDQWLKAQAAAELAEKRICASITFTTMAWFPNKNGTKRKPNGKQPNTPKVQRCRCTN